MQITIDIADDAAELLGSEPSAEVAAKVESAILAPLRGQAEREKRFIIAGQIHDLSADAFAKVAAIVREDRKAPSGDKGSRP